MRTNYRFDESRRLRHTTRAPHAGLRTTLVQVVAGDWLTAVGRIRERH